jgi:hypothetical protein
MKRAVPILLSLGLVLGLPACSAPTSSSSIDVTLTYDPDPASASGPGTGVTYKVTNSDDTTSYYEYDWRTTFSVHIQETGGKALDITQLNITVQQATGGIVIPPSGGDQIYYKFNSSAATNHVNAKGSADVGFDVWYDNPNGNKEALITVGLNFEDEDSIGYSETVKVKVAP